MLKMDAHTVENLTLINLHENHLVISMYDCNRRHTEIEPIYLFSVLLNDNGTFTKMSLSGLFTLQTNRYLRFKLKKNQYDVRKQSRYHQSVQKQFY